jgi:hypothetical protein
LLCATNSQYFPSAFIWLIEQQCIHALEASPASAKKCKVIFGLPTYDDLTIAIAAWKKLLNELRGMQKGLKGNRAKAKNLDGLALFADYTIDERERANYQRNWLECEDR